MFKKYEGLFLSARSENPYKISSAYPLEGGTEETLYVDYGKTIGGSRTKGTALSQIKISFYAFDDVKALAGQTYGTLNGDARRKPGLCRWGKTTERWSLYAFDVEILRSERDVLTGWSQNKTLSYIWEQ